MIGRIFRSGFLQLIVLTVALALAGSAWAMGSRMLGWQHLTAAALLSVCWAVQIIRPDRLWLIILFTLLAATLNAAMFLPAMAWIWFRVSVFHADLKIGLHPVFGPILVYS